MILTYVAVAVAGVERVLLPGLAIVVVAGLRVEMVRGHPLDEPLRALRPTVRSISNLFSVVNR